MGWTWTEYGRSLRVEACKPDSNATYLSQQAIPQQTYNLFTPNIHLTIMRGKNRVTVWETYSNRNRFLFNVRLEWNDVTSLEKKQRNGWGGQSGGQTTTPSTSKSDQNTRKLTKWKMRTRRKTSAANERVWLIWIVINLTRNCSLCGACVHRTKRYTCTVHNDVILYSLAAKVEQNQ